MSGSSRVRVLVADDRREIIDDFRKILCPPTLDIDTVLADMQSVLFSKEDAKWKNTEKSYSDYHLTGVSQGEEAISEVRQALADNDPFTLAFLDIRMPPGIDGVQTAVELHKLDPCLHIVFVSAYSDYSRNEILQMVGEGARDKLLYVSKPFSPDEIRHVAGTLAAKWRSEATLARKIARLNATHDATLHTLIELMEHRTCNQEARLSKVARFTALLVGKLRHSGDKELAAYIDDDYVEDIVKASIFHDIGKVGIPDHLLCKSGFLDIKDFEKIQEHCNLGGNALNNAILRLKEEGATFLTLAREIAYCHHEKFDGSGYPKGLKGDEIPLSARIVSLVDVYDALTSERPQRPAMGHHEACEVICQRMGASYFDPVVLKVFQESMGEFELIGKEQ